MVTYIKKYWQIVVIVILVILYIGVYQKEYKTGQRNSALTQIIQDKADSIKVYENKNGNLVAEKKALELSKKQLKDNLDLLEIDKKQLKNQIGNLNNLVATLKTEIKTIGELKVEQPDTVFIVDSTKTVDYSFPIYWTNNFLTLRGDYSSQIFLQNNALNITDQILQIEYDYNLSFTSTTYYKRDRFLQKKKLYQNLSFTDPNIDVVNMQQIQIVLPEKKFYERDWFKFGTGFLTGFLVTR